uniref:Pept_C1 domain-containing protein n=1 Tax=Heterorhabditis bacteriophora TaxID=37862 RepID=A0A1I7WVT1_HETBA
MPIKHQECDKHVAIGWSYEVMSLRASRSLGEPQIIGDDFQSMDKSRISGNVYNQLSKEFVPGTLFTEHTNKYKQYNNQRNWTCGNGIIKELSRYMHIISWLNLEIRGFINIKLINYDIRVQKMSVISTTYQAVNFFNNRRCVTNTSMMVTRIGLLRTLKVLIMIFYIKIWNHIYYR